MPTIICFQKEIGQTSTIGIVKKLDNVTTKIGSNALFHEDLVLSFHC